MPENSYATKQDLQELRTHVDERLDQVDARFNQVIETTRDMQTEVLRAFHNWARPAEVKIRSHEERLTLLEERVSEIERGNKSN
ncbi:MAG: hypothetical protein LAO55_13645 [Acidobacteriia bacterium]|nr:hypothetical protein [Terriglobia bacterium]